MGHVNCEKRDYYHFIYILLDKTFLKNVDFCSLYTMLIINYKIINIGQTVSSLLI